MIIGNSNIDDIISEIEEKAREIIKIYAKIVNLKPQVDSCENYNLFSNNNIYNGDNILKNIDSLREILSEKHKENKQIFDKNFKQDDLFLELIIIEHQSLFIILLERFNLNNDKFEDVENDSYTYKCVYYLCLLLNLMINNLLIIQKCVHLGFNHQVNLIFRNYIELSEISSAILISESFFKLYTSEPENKKEINKKWLQVRPQAVHELIGKEYMNINGLENWWSCINEIRDSLYEKTSGFVHGNYSRIITESFSKELNVDNVSLTSLGLISDNLKDTFSEIIIFSKIFIRDILIFLVKNHKLHFSKFGQDGLDHLYLQSITNYMFDDYIKNKKAANK